MGHSAVVGSWTLLSRFLGFGRDVGFAMLLGTSALADAFLVAFKLPNVFRRLFAEGAFTQSFVPIFLSVLQKDKSRAFAFASHAGRWLFIVSAVVVVAGEIFMPVVMRIIAPGFAIEGTRFTWAVELARVLFPFVIASALGAWLGAILNSLGHYGLAAAQSVILNIVMLFAIMAHFLWEFSLTPAHVIAWGVLLAGMVQIIVLACRTHQLGVHLSWRSEERALLKRMVRLALPVVLGAGVYQLSVLIDIVLASLLPQGSVSYLYYADRLAQLPLGVIGIAIGTVLLPQLAHLISQGKQARAFALQRRAVFFGFLCSCPAMVGLFILAEPIIATLFDYGAFVGVAPTAAALQAFAVGIPAFVLVKSFAPAFFAREHTKSPVRFALMALVLNVVLSLILMNFIAHVGLALATSLASWFNAMLLRCALIKRGWYQTTPAHAWRMVKIIVASLVMGMVLLLLLPYASWDEAGGRRIFFLASLIFAGMISYAITLISLGMHKIIMEQWKVV